MPNLATAPAHRPGARAAEERPRLTYQPRPRSATGRINVGETERWLSAFGGGVLGLLGLSRGGLGGLALAAAGGSLVYRGVTGHCSGYQALGVSTAGRASEATSVPATHGYKVDLSFTVNRPAAELFRFWRDFSNLPKVMSHLESVQVESDHRSHWVARGPAGMTVSWEAELINEKPDRLIAWRSLGGSTVDTAGSVHFNPAPGGRGTEVRVELKYNPPAGKLGAWAAALFGRDPEKEVREDLRRFKQVMETGENPTTQGQPRGHCC